MSYKINGTLVNNLMNLGRNQSFSIWKRVEVKAIIVYIIGILYTKIVLTYCEKKLFWQSIKVLKFEAEGQEFAQFLRSLEQFIQTVKGQNNFW